MFRGQFVHTIDAKGRISVPARFRDAVLADGDARLVMAPSPFDACLHLYRMADWVEFEAKIAELPRFDAHIVRFRRVYVSAAQECELDRSGRLLVSPDFRDKAELMREVMWAGMGRFVELWAKDRWDAATMPLSTQENERFLKSIEELIRI
jgi:MraZ protein